MKDTRYVTKPNNNVKNAAVGYQYDGTKYNPSDIDEFAVGGAGVYSTAKDLQKWLTEMETHRLFGNAFWNTMIAENPAKGKGFTYTKGLFNFKYANHTMISHGGDVVGFHPLTAYFPTEKIAVVILGNDDDFERYPILDAAVSILLGDKYDYPKTQSKNEEKEEENVVTESISIPPAVLESYAGNYELTPGYAIAITTEEGKLRLIQLWDETTVLLPPAKQEHHFEISGATLIFSDFLNGKTMQMRVKTGEEDSIYKRLATAPDFTLYDKYTGTFYSSALNATITFFTENGILRYRFKDNESFIASPPESEDLFLTQHGKITFKKNQEGEITGFVLDHERVLNMGFTKKLITSGR